MARRGWRLLTALALGTTAAAAASPDPALTRFLSPFADMAAHGAADAMAKVTRFPLRNRVFHEPERIGAAGFKLYFAQNHFRDLADCLKREAPKRVGARDADLGEWRVECDGNLFYFAKDPGGWRFSGFENVNE